MEQTQMKESDGPLKEALDSLKEALDSLCVLPRDIDRLCPYIGEPVYVDADGSGNFKTMTLASITPRYLTFRIGSPRTSLGWLEFKVCRRRTGLGFTFVLWRSPLGGLHGRFQEVEACRQAAKLREGEVTVGRREE